MKSKLIIISAMITISLCLFACTKVAEDTGAIEDTTWVLESYGEQENMQAVLEGTEITAIFESADGLVRGSSGCNSYGGEYSINKNKLTIPEVSYTEMGCLEPEGIMEQEEQFLRAIIEAESYEIKNATLRVFAGSQVLVFNAR